MGFKSDVTKRALCALRCRSIPRHVYLSILTLQYRPIVELDGHLECLLQISPKCSKIITYLQNTLDLINIIIRLNYIIIVSKDTYTLWMKMGQIHSLSMALSLDLLGERREAARLRNWSYQKDVARTYNKKVRTRTFQQGDWVLRRAEKKNGETHPRVGRTL